MDLTPTEKEHLSDLQHHPGWRILTEKVWAQQRQWIISGLLRPNDNVEFSRGEWNGFAKAEQSIQWVMLEAPSMHETTPYEEQTFEEKLGLYRGINK